MTKRYRKFCDAEYEACRLLKDEGWQAYRIAGGLSPPDLVAMGPAGWVAIMVRSSRSPVPDAHAAALKYPREVARMRTVAGTAKRNFRVEVWIRSPPDGWKRYRVFPFGLMRVFPGELYNTPPELLDLAGEEGQPDRLMPWEELFRLDHLGEEDIVPDREEDDQVGDAGDGCTLRKDARNIEDGRDREEHDPVEGPARNPTGWPGPLATANAACDRVTKHA
ncbi:hypothetical protein J2741_000261 [Methanolinea mesophila]|uniref:hypothetical protein n=1 Tax=Methanolinea mesophila TaxID=547055 RepID=UPI001AE8508E|nr:hypothetical protein [Methanolinea mesophila]MBP1927714.1 hypothetical protein [Methanolinea mesophila]